MITKLVPLPADNLSHVNLKPKETVYAKELKDDQIVNVKINNSVYKKFRMLCNITTEEWIGIIFYKVIDDLNLEVFDLLPRSIDTSAFTSDFLDESFTDYIETNDLYEAKYGLIHSHNHMNVFFSHEDFSELKTNAKNYDQYLSIIVNVRDEVCAKVAIHCDAVDTEEIVNYNNQFGQPQQLRVVKNSSNMLLIRDCNVNIEKEELVQDGNFIALTEKLLVSAIEKKKAAAQRQAQYKTTSPHGTPHTPSYDMTWIKLFITKTLQLNKTTLSNANHYQICTILSNYIGRNPNDNVVKLLSPETFTKWCGIQKTLLDSENLILDFKDLLKRHVSYFPNLNNLFLTYSQYQSVTKQSKTASFDEMYPSRFNGAF